MGNRTVCAGAAAQRCIDECTNLQVDLDGRSRDGEVPECDPAGAVFDDTLRDTSPPDQEALRFASSSNLPAVRWLLVMGANPKARDGNGTTMLHAACRSGSCSIVQELVRYGLQLDAVDTAQWTPLHIAAMMGRREVSLFLLRARAQLNLKNRRGATPLEVCSDPGTKEVLEAVTRESGSSLEQSPGPASMDTRSSETAAGNMTFDEHDPTCEPFFVPRCPVFHDEEHRYQIVGLGMHMFDHSPGHGLAFLVATGAMHDHPTDISAFLLRHKADPCQLGEFLGEDFSLAHTLRLAFVHATDLKGTGCFSALCKAFGYIRVPQGLQKIDRLTSSVAHMWWRCHQLDDEDPWGDAVLAEEDYMDWTIFAEDTRLTGAVPPEHAPVEVEAVGTQLRRAFRSFEGFRRLMFSTMMLCWNLHGGTRCGRAAASHVYAASPRRFTLLDWLGLNAGIEIDGGDVPTHVLQGIYQQVNKRCTPQLFPDFTTVGEGEANAAKKPAASRAQTSSMNLEGWASIPHGGLERIDTYMAQGAGPSLAHCVFSETSNTAGRPLPPFYAGLPQRQRQAGNTAGEAVWLSLHSWLFLFLSSSPDDLAPYAFIRLQDAVLRDVDHATFHFVLGGRLKDPAVSTEDTSCGGAGSSSGSKKGKSPARITSLPFGDPQLALPLCFLLADGRFQLFEALWLEIQLGSAEELEAWAVQLGAACDCARGAMDRALQQALPNSCDCDEDCADGIGVRLAKSPMPGARTPPPPPEIADDMGETRTI